MMQPQTALQVILLLSFISVLHAGSWFGGDAANQTCDGTSKSNSQFYCEHDEQCYNRSLRCVEADVCINPVTNKEECCNETVHQCTGKYNIILGRSKLFGKRRKRFWWGNYKLEHQFIVYRGFAYEFGSYGVQILDICDPLYKYKNGKDLKKNGLRVVGSGYCTWEDAKEFVDGWDEKYKLIGNNCQHFANGLKEFLTTGVCSQPPSDKDKREDREAEVEEQVKEILKWCCHEIEDDD